MTSLTGLAGSTNALDAVDPTTLLVLGGVVLVWLLVWADRRIVLDPHRLRRYAGPCPPAVRKALGV